MKSVKKTQFAGVNDKCFYFHGGIVKRGNLEKKKKSIEQTFIQKFKKKMYESLALQSRAVHLCERLKVLISIYAQPPLLYLLNSQILLQIKSLKSTRELIIKGSWK